MGQELGNYLRVARFTSGVTQVELAKHLGYKTPQTVSDVERGVLDVPPEKMRDWILRIKGDFVEVQSILVKEYVQKLDTLLEGK